MSPEEKMYVGARVRGWVGVRVRVWVWVWGFGYRCAGAGGVKCLSALQLGIITNQNVRDGHDYLQPKK